MESSTQPLAAIYARQSKDKTRSTDEQEAEAREVCEAQGWRIREVYRDGTSASRFTTKARPDWDRLLTDLVAGRFNILVLWESSRGDRSLTSWSALLDNCRKHGVRIHVVSHEQTYDLSVSRHWETLANDGVKSASESESTSRRLKRAAAAGAKAGRPYGPIAYGYERVYELVDNVRVLVEQRPHPEQAPIVEEIITRIGKSDPIVHITNDLTRRGVPSPTGGAWDRSSVRRIATNVAYVGQRRHNGDTHAGAWPPLVEQGVFDAAARVLSDPTRKTTRPGRAMYLLSYLISCGVCGGPCQARSHRQRLLYSCSQKGCTAIRADWVDDWVTELVLRRLTQPDVYNYLTAADDALVLAARNEAKALRVKLDEFYDSALKPDGISAAALARIEAKYLPEIAAADKRAKLAATPPVLRDLLEPGADVKTRWDAMPMAARREVISLLLSISLDRAPDPHRGKAAVFDPDRLNVEWL